MNESRDRRVTALFGIDLPVVQAPMAGATTAQMVVAVSDAGGLGSLPGAALTVAQMTAALDTIRAATSRPINLNFFAHVAPPPDPVAQMAWRARLAPYYVEHGLDPALTPSPGGRAPFDEAYCAIVEAYRPEVVSFHFGLPDATLLRRVHDTGAKVIASATTVAEARWLVERGVDAVIAMGYEAGGHRGNFLGDDMASQVGTMSLVPQVVDAVPVPVIAAGGIADARGVRAAFALGASAVQVGTAYLFTPEAQVGDAYRAALHAATDDGTMVTNVFTGRPARGIANRLVREVGPLSDLVPAFPTAAAAVGPLRSANATDFANHWSGQSAPLARDRSSAELTRLLGDAAGFSATAPDR
ncbi:nitronate monooxygenase family protein [Luteibacter sp. PPL201]|uniref:Propionate 3-nitronate monooxygenase n=1 Tax=Luteibacter sahnii TaxID=3021977 RepID=A0ABT6BDC5_9GAMM|nr:nitronate monooxygenase family protein [Luteibacter sp. PPL193]MDY1549887.1 nitronate monooxygenase family protein [Luteibacter sp. PPL193]